MRKKLEKEKEVLDEGRGTGERGWDQKKSKRAQKNLKGRR